MATTAPLPYHLDASSHGLRFEGSADERLAHLVAEASESAFAALYERHHQALYRYCRSIVRDDTDAQDALQSAWTRALVALRRGQRDAPVRPWLYRIVHNESISLLRRRGRAPEGPPTAADRVPSAEDHALDRERFASLLADLRELPERPRGALLMRELSGLTHEEIAAALDTSVSAAKQCIYAARRDLSELAAGRAAPCDDICRRISDGDRRVLRGRRVTAHLRDCPSCAAFASTIDRRTAGLHALAPWLPAVAATAVLHGALRSGWGAGAAGATGTAGATATAGTTGAAVTPAAVTAGVVTKAVGVPLLGKALIAVVAVTAGVASVTGGGPSHAVPRSTPAPAPAPARALSAVSGARLASPRLASPRHAGRHTSRAAMTASHARAASPGHAPTAAANGTARRVAAGHSSAVAPGQAEKATGTPPGQAKKTTGTPPGQATKAAAASPPGQIKKVATTPPGQAKKVATTPPGQAKKVAATPPGHATQASATPPSQAATTSTTAPGQVQQESAVTPPSTDAPGNSGVAHSKLTPSSP